MQILGTSKRRRKLSVVRLTRYLALATALLAIWLGPLGGGGHEARPVPFAVFHSLAFAAGLLALLDRLRDPKRAPSFRPVLPLFLLCFAGIYWGAGTVLFHKVLAYPLATRLFSLAASLSLGIAGFHLARASKDHRELLLFGIVGTAGLQAAIGVFQGLHCSGSYPNHAHFGGLLEMGLPLALALGFRERKSSRRRGFAMSSRYLAFFMVLGLILSFSRGAWLAATLGLAVFLLLSLQERNGKSLAGVLLALGLLAGGLSLHRGSQMIETRLSSLDPESLQATEALRIHLWTAAWKIGKKHPILGCGLNQFVVAYPEFREPGSVKRAQSAHNELLESFAEGGIPLLGIHLLIAFGWLALLVREYREAEGAGRRTELAAGIGAWVALFGHGLVDFNLHIPANLSIFHILLCALAARPAGFHQFRTDGRTLTEEELGEIKDSVRRLPPLGLVVSSVGLLAGFGFCMQLVRFETLGRSARALIEKESFSKADRIVQKQREIFPRASLSYEIELESVRKFLTRVDGNESKALYQRGHAILDALEELEPYVGRRIVSRSGLLRGQFTLTGDGSFLEKADRLLKEANERAPHDPPILAEWATVDILKGDLEKASGKIRASLSNFPVGKRPVTLVLRLARSGLPPDWIQSSIPEDFAQGWMVLAHEFKAKGNLSRANQSFAMARKADPENLDIRSKRGIFLQSVGQYREALVDLEFARDRVKEPSEPLQRALVDCYRALRSPRLETEIRRGLNQWPQSVEWPILLTEYYLESNQFEKAKGVLKTLSEKFEVAPEGPYGLAQIKERKGMQFGDRQILRDACSLYRDALSRDREHLPSSRRLALLYWYLGDKSRGAQLFEEQFRRKQIDPAGKVLLAESYLDKGRSEFGLRLAQEALQESASEIVLGETIQVRFVRLVAQDALSRVLYRK